MFLFDRFFLSLTDIYGNSGMRERHLDAISMKIHICTFFSQSLYNHNSIYNIITAFFASFRFLDVRSIGFA